MNPFNTDVVFHVQLQQGPKKDRQGAGKGKGSKQNLQKNNRGSSLSGALPPASTSPPPEPFFCKHEFLRLKKGAQNIIQVTFLPFEMGTHRCFVVLVDEQVGEI